MVTEGVYHFSPVDYRFSYSHFAVNTKNEMKNTDFLNCKKKGKNFNEVIELVKSNMNYSDVLISRIEDYERYGNFYMNDPQSKIGFEEI